MLRLIEAGHSPTRGVIKVSEHNFLSAERSPDETENERLAALHAYGILDTPREPEYDDVVRMAAEACAAPMAHINFVDADRQWFKAEIGLGVRELPREPGICNCTLDQDDLLVFEDLERSAQFADSVLVTGPLHLRFYAGVTLKAPSGHAIGTLCVLDREPRRLTEAQVFILRALARNVMASLEMRRTDAALRASEARLMASEARQAFLLGLADTARVQTDPRAIMQAAVASLGRHLGVSRVGYGRIQPDGRTILRQVSYAEGVQAPDGPLDMDQFGSALLELQRSGRTVVVADVLDGRKTPVTPDPALWEQVATRAFVSVPLVREGRFVAALYVTHHAPRAWTVDDIALIESVAARTWDAVERAGAEAAHREDAAHHRQILDSTIDYAIIAMDREGRVTQWNEGARRLLGWNEPEMLGKSAERLFTPEDRARGQFETEMAMAVAKGVGSDERWHLRKTGERFWASGELTPLRDAKGETTGFVKVLRDRTGEQLAREALDEIRQRQEIALDTSRVGFFDWNVEEDTIEGDARFARFLGIDPDAMARGLPLPAILERINPADRDAVATNIARSMAALSDYTNEYRVGTDGQTRWVMARATCYASAHGKPLRYAGTLIDVTEQKQIQALLRQSEERYRSLFNSIDAGFCLIDVVFDQSGTALDYRFVEVNPAFERQTGIKHAAGKLMRELAPEHEQHWFDLYGQVARTGEPVRVEYAAEALDRRWYDVYAFRIGSPETRRVAVLFNDISTRRRLDLQLRRLNETLEQQVAARTAERDRVWRNARDLLAVLDRPGRFRAVNPAWQTTLGYRPEDVVGRDFLNFVLPEDVERSQEAHATAGRENLSSFENRYRHSDGSLRTIAWRTSVEGEFIYAYGRDVTEERERQDELTQAQEALRQSQKMEAVGQLTGGVAHDFNNLLTIIRSSVDLLRRPDLPDERRKRYMDAVSDTVDRAAKLTGQLLAFARRQALKPEVFDVGERLRGVADMLDTVTGTRIRVVTQVPDDPCFVRADVSQFETALINMGVNARDAMDGEGKLTLRLECAAPMPALRGHASARGPFAAISLSDTGSGIAPDQLGRIFEPFFTTKEVGRGTGLGLSQVFGFAKQSGGDVAVESAFGEGTTFTLFLPQIDPPHGADHARGAADDLSEDGGGQRVLVVEDNIEVGRFATQILEDLGYQTEWAVNAEDALDKLGEDGAGFDVVFSDVVMPGMGGIALAENLRRRLPDLPIVLASGYSHVLAQEGAHGFELLQKPYSTEQLSRMLRRVVNARRVVQA